MLLCLPGLFCWVMLAGAVLHWLTGYGVPLWDIRGLSHPNWITLLWACAVVAALISLVIYLPRRDSARPWYVRLCLLINIAGLLFTFALVALSLVAGWLLAL